MDVQPISSQAYYRIRIVDNNGNYKYTNIILLSVAAIDVSVRSLVNPFQDRLSFEMTVPEDSQAGFTVLDRYGKVGKYEKQQVVKGLNNIAIFGLSGLSSGIYTLQVQYADKLISKRIAKLQQ